MGDRPSDAGAEVAVRRPAAPHLRTGRPGAPTPAPPAVETPAAPSREEAAPQLTALTAPAPLRSGRTGRRAVLLVGAAAAVGSAVSVGALLREDGAAAPSAASSPGVAPAGDGSAGPFADVAADDPAAEAIRWADETGVQPALTATDYSPQDAVNRGDVALALHRMAGAPAVDLGSAPVPFTDLGEDAARVTAMLWLHGRGAVWGDAELRVHPDEPATRDCAAAMLTALLRPALAGMGVTWDASAEASLPQADGQGSALADVAWLEASGMAPASLSAAAWSGEEGVTRADLAVSLHRADEVVATALG